MSSLHCSVFMNNRQMRGRGKNPAHIVLSHFLLKLFMALNVTASPTDVCRLCLKSNLWNYLRTAGFVISLFLEEFLYFKLSSGPWVV